jgi:hypothetical protein
MNRAMEQLTSAARAAEALYKNAGASTSQGPEVQRVQRFGGFGSQVLRRARRRAT